MKKQLTITARRCIIAMLLFPLWGLGGLYAAVTVTPISADYASQKVTFKVAWTGTAANNRVWVWIDLCPVVGASPSTFAKAVISAASATSGSIDAASLNGRGFYVTTNPSTVTATLNNATGKFNWCAYGSDYPPNAIETSGTYTLKGSPPFIITTSGGTVAVSTKTYSGGTITAITDATGCPGVLCGKNGELTGLLNCCVTGTTNCSGTCATTRTYTQNDGACAGTCNKAYVRQFNQCGRLVSSTYRTYTNMTCLSGCAFNCTNCKNACDHLAPSYLPYSFIQPVTKICHCGSKYCNRNIGPIIMKHIAWKVTGTNWVLHDEYEGNTSCQDCDACD
jgi:hypothetical protein